MKKLLNTLYVTTPEAYLTLEGENVVVKSEGSELGRMPLHNLEAILSFNYPGASPALMGACVERDVDLCFFTPTNRFLARVVGTTAWVGTATVPVSVWMIVAALLMKGVD